MNDLQRALGVIIHASLLLAIATFPGTAAAVEEQAVDFENDLIPVFTKLGCNAGACHGSAAGRGGFKLSLYGGTPAADYDAIVRQLEGRRINLQHPAQSLVVLKPSESLAHGGGYLMKDDDESCRLLIDWISQGAQLASRRKLERIEVTPRRVAVAVNDQVPVEVIAHYNDGSAREVSGWTVFTPEDASAVSYDVDSNALTVHRRGRHIVVARYLNQVVPLELLVPLNAATSTNVAQLSDNFIDQEIASALNALGLPPSPACNDATFRRRVTLHLTGRLPSPVSDDEVRLDRSQLVDQLLSSDEFVEYWTLQFAKLLRIRPQANDTQGAETYHAWLSEQLRRSTAYDQIARELILAAGDSHKYGPANFYRTVSGPREQAEFVSELFMASRLRCANCHNHPLDRWTQDDYHGLAAIFAKIDPGQVVRVKAEGEVIHPQTLEAAKPRIPGEFYLENTHQPSADTAADALDGRQQLAEWLTSRDNPYFAAAIVNRLWKHLMGRGLVEPVDDFRATNPATHPQLLNKLANDFVAGGYDLRHTLKVITSSACYARSALALPENQDDDRFYSHALRTELEPEVLADALADVLEIPENYGNLPIGTRAVALVNPQTPSASLDVLGRCDREDSCESVNGNLGGLSQKLHLFNGALLNARLSAPGSRLDKLLSADRAPLAIIVEFYQVALGRLPSELEVRHWQEQLESLPALEFKAEVRKLLEDFVWSLVTCEEFVTNH